MQDSCHCSSLVVPDETTRTTENFSLSNSVLMRLDTSAGIKDRPTRPLLKDVKLACQISTEVRSNRKVKRGKEMKAGARSILSGCVKNGARGKWKASQVRSKSARH